MRLAWGLALALSATTAAAQGPAAEWRTVETAHFRVHYPVELEAWATARAERLESVRAAVSERVGYAPQQIVDVVVADPLAQPNGAAWPLLGRPRMVLWSTPPTAASTLGQLADWGELVTVHEVAHLVHLLRPSRDPLRALAERTVLPLGPLATGSPRWAIEGYATLLEGRLTGRGRPRSALRAAVLRQWARQGRLPSYRRLSGDRDAFLGQSMPYLAGSAFLEWLEGRSTPPDPLPRLWAAATARGRRSFEQAFERVFAERPEALWSRFVAETTAGAIERERHLGSSAVEGELWLDREGGGGALQVSPDGRRLVALVTPPRQPSRLVVWSLEPVAPAPAATRAPVDPEDPSALSAPPRRREPEATLELAPPRRPLGGRFLPDGETLLVGLLAPDARGDLHAELALWKPGSALRRLTRSGDLRDADPLPDGRHAVAVRWRHGHSGLVRVDLANGATVDLVAPVLDRIQDRPRVSPDGTSLAWLEHRGGRWNVFVARLRNEEPIADARTLDPSSEGEPLDLAWRGDGSLLYVAVARGEELDIEALPVLDGALAHRVTRSVGAALGPAPTPDGRELYFLALDADGFDIRRLDLDAATVQERTAAGAEPASAVETAAPGSFVAGSLTPSRSYGPGRPEWTALVAGSAGSGPGGVEAGIRVGDLLGRWELVALGAGGGDRFADGGALRLVTRPFGGDLEVHLARFDDGAGTVDAAEVRAAGSLEGWPGTLAWLVGLGATRSGVEGLERSTGFAGVELATVRTRARARLRPRLALAATVSSGDSDARFGRALLGLDADLGDWAAELVLERREVDDDDAHDLLSLGGAASSLVPTSARPGRIYHPALPPGVATGSRYEVVHLRLARRGPLGLLVEHHRLDSGARIDLLGADLRWSLPPTPLLGLPALRLEAGLARIDREGRADETRWWLGLVFPVRQDGAGAATHAGFSTTRPRR